MTSYVFMERSFDVSYQFFVLRDGYLKCGRFKHLQSYSFVKQFKSNIF